LPMIISKLKGKEVKKVEHSDVDWKFLNILLL
jgi:hypothetical protein